MKYSRFILLILSIVVTICSTSCYKSDIENLQKQINELKGSSIASLESQVSAITTTIGQLQTSQAQLQGYISELQKDSQAYKTQITELQTIDTKLGEKITGLKNYTENELSNAKTWVEGTFATLDQMDSLCIVIADITVILNEIETQIDSAKAQITQSYTKAIKESVAASEASMKKWINEQLADYYSIAEVDAILDSICRAHTKFDSTIIAKIKEQKVALDSTKSQITAAYRVAIKTAIDSLEGKINEKTATVIATAKSELQSQINSINNEIANIKSRLDAAEMNIESLINQIQSIVVIPTYSDGSVEITDIVDTLSFDIRPARIADSIAAKWKYASTDTREKIISFQIQDVLTKGTSTPSAIVDTVFCKNGELKIGVHFANVSNRNSIASLHITSGATDISSGYFGLFKKSNYLCFEALQAGSTVGMTNLSKAGAPKLEYSNDGSNFNIWDGTGVSLTNVGDKVYFRAGSSGNSSFVIDLDNDEFCSFSTTGDLKVSGNIMYLLDGTSPSTEMTEYNNYCFFGLFAMTSVSDASNLLLPATKLAKNCYQSMFVESLLTDAPALPATILADECYANMFYQCIHLSAPPTLPATILKDGCYSYMFEGCTSLAAAPALPATTLADECYTYMFEGCTSLAAAPALPATTLADECYYYMFGQCTSLATVPDLPATALAKGCCSYMFKGCIGLAAAPSLPATTLADECYYYMFKECTNLTVAPDLPATELANSCYYMMFDGCSSLSSAQDSLPAKALKDDCYNQMFFGCISLTKAPVICADSLGKYSCSSMFGGCKQLTDVPDFTMDEVSGYGCCQSMFSGCTALKNAPALPATTLGTACYLNMFAGCTELATVPPLPATVLTEKCYYEMFKDCSKLSSVKLLATGGFDTDRPLYQWLDDAGTSASSRTVTASNNLNPTQKEYLEGNVPTGTYAWTVQYDLLP